MACLAGQSPPAQKKKDAERNSALKKAVVSYRDQIEDAASKDDDEDEEAEHEEEENDGDEQGAHSLQWSRDKGRRSAFLKSPEMILLSAIAHNNRF